MELHGKGFYDQTYFGVNAHYTLRSQIINQMGNENKDIF